MSTELRPARAALLQFCREWDAVACEAKRQGQPVGWASTKFPAEVAAALDLVTCCPESLAAALAARGSSGPLCRTAEELGYCNDLCSYMRIGLAAASGAPTPGKTIPLPDFLLCCNNICAGMLQWYQNLSRILNIPLFLLDFPYTGREEPDEALLRYLRAQLQAVYRQLADLCCKPADPARLEEMARISSRTSASWNRLCALQNDPASAVEDTELLDYMPALVSRRCDSRLAGLLDACAEEQRSLPAPRTAPRVRLMLEGTPCWPCFGQLTGRLQEAGVKICADTLTPSLGFTYSDLDEMLAAYAKTINGSPLSAGIRSRIQLCSRRDADAVLVHYNRSCRPWCGTLPELSRQLKAAGFPNASFHGDQADPQQISWAQCENAVQALLEMLESG